MFLNGVSGDMQALNDISVISWQNYFYFQDLLLLSVAGVADIGALQPRSSRLVRRRLLLRHRILRPRQAEVEQQGHKHAENHCTLLKASLNSKWSSIK